MKESRTKQPYKLLTVCLDGMERTQAFCTEAERFERVQWLDRARYLKIEMIEDLGEGK